MKRRINLNLPPARGGCGDMAVVTPIGSSAGQSRGSEIAVLKSVEADSLWTMRAKRCIVLVLHTAQLYGAATSLLHHARFLRSLGVPVHVLLAESGPLEAALQDEGFHVDVIPLPHFGLRRAKIGAWFIVKLTQLVLSRLAFVLKATRFFRRLPTLLVHVHSAHCSYAVVAAKLSGCSVVWHVREERARGLAGRWKGLLLRALADSVVFVSHGIRRGYEIPDRKVSVIYNGVALPKQVLTPRRAEEPLRILFAGQMQRAKGIFEFVEICRLLTAHQMKFAATMVGEGASDEMYDLRRAIAEASLLHQIHIGGYNHDMGAVYGSHDVLLLPSYSDSLPRVVMEAMSYGLPVVASRVGGIPELVEDNVTGFLFDLQDLDHAVTALGRLASDPEMAAAMGRRGRDRVLHMFGNDRYEQAITRVYQRVARS